MRFLVDENIPLDLVVALRVEGHDVIWVPESDFRGADDDVIWRHAAQDQRVFVTGDLDFPLSSPNPPGMLLLRGADRLSTRTMSSLLLVAVRSLGDDVLGYLVVVSPGRVRRRLLS